ncbi:MAG: hypothetical protein LBH34_02025, partial [Prevotellaceae bacterium]|nr:hypothetical protein [Prevotellaceae bacterium]
ATLSYSFIQSGSEQGGRHSNIIRLSLSYGYKKHSLNLSAIGNFIYSRNSTKGTDTRTQEWMANLTYSYSFSVVAWERKIKGVQN